MSTTTTAAVEPITADNILRLFPEINTSLASAASGQSNELEGYDEEQVRLMEEVCIVLDEDDKPIGSASKKVCV
jgi:isopentenyl-diphosphate delta-isomerase